MTTTTAHAPCIDSVHSQTLDLPPSCIQFCPSRPDIFCIGTYFLHRQEEEQKDPNDAGEEPEQVTAQKRTGSLILFRLDDNNSITRLSTLPTDYAVLDIQWNPHEEVLAVASSTGDVVFYRLTTESQELEHVKTITIDEEVLVLSLIWHPIRAHVLGLTLSDGKVLLLRSESEKPLWSPDAEVVRSEIHSHELEAWISAFSSSDEDDVLLSGGDDMALRSSRIEPTHQHLYQDRKLHQAGITYLLPLPSSCPDLVITGSYDDHIRLLYLPPLGRRRILAELNLEGGVWRLKVLESDNNNQHVKSIVLLASCMHAGSRIVRLIREPEPESSASEPENASWHFEVLARFEEHQSMNYGSDAVQASNGWKIVSTSFYDKLMCLWTWKDDR